MKLLLKRILFNAWVLVVCTVITTMIGWRNWADVGPWWSIATVAALTSVDYLADWVKKSIKRTKA